MLLQDGCSASTLQGGEKRGHDRVSKLKLLGINMATSRLPCDQTLSSSFISDDSSLFVELTVTWNGKKLLAASLSIPQCQAHGMTVRPARTRHGTARTVSLSRPAERRCDCRRGQVVDDDANEALGAASATTSQRYAQGRTVPTMSISSLQRRSPRLRNPCS